MIVSNSELNLSNFLFADRRTSAGRSRAGHPIFARGRGRVRRSRGFGRVQSVVELNKAEAQPSGAPIFNIYTYL